MSIRPIPDKPGCFLDTKTGEEICIQEMRFVAFRPAVGSKLLDGAEVTDVIFDASGDIRRSVLDDFTQQLEGAPVERNERLTQYLSDW